MRSIFFAVTGLVLVTSASAWATPNFPPGIEQDLELDAPPACGLCHTDGEQGGLGTVNTAFGKSVRAHGLVAFDTAALRSALDEMESEKVNSAGACLDDIDELKAGGDPNTEAPAGSCGDEKGSSQPVTNAASDAPTSSSGCAVSAAPPSGEFAAAFVIGAAVLASRRRRRGVS